MISFPIFIIKKHERFRVLNNKENTIRVVKIEKVRRWVRATTVYTYIFIHYIHFVYTVINKIRKSECILYLFIHELLI